MTTKYDRVYYWVGGNERGEWREAGPFTSNEQVDAKIVEIRKMGYVAVAGKSTIGAPEGVPAELRG